MPAKQSLPWDSWLSSLYVDYHAVPKIIGQKKEFALNFEKMWQKYVGVGKLVYTRTESGREILLKARMESLSASFQNKSERVSVWK